MLGVWRRWSPLSRSIWTWLAVTSTDSYVIHFDKIVLVRLGDTIASLVCIPTDCCYVHQICLLFVGILRFNLMLIMCILVLLHSQKFVYLSTSVLIGVEAFFIWARFSNRKYYTHQISLPNLFTFVLVKVVVPLTRHTPLECRWELLNSPKFSCSAWWVLQCSSYLPWVHREVLVLSGAIFCKSNIKPLRLFFS